MGKVAVWAIAGLIILSAVLYAAGFRIVGPNGRPLLAGAGDGNGIGLQQPGSRRSGGNQGQTNYSGTGQGGPGSGQGGGPGGGGGQRRRMAQANGGGPGSGQGKGASRRQGGGGGGGQGSQGSTPGFGPSGGILLPSQLGTASIPVSVGGKASASFVGKDLVDHVEDTVIATADGPRKGWSIDKTLKYLGIQQYKEVILTGADGKTLAVSAKQLQDSQTIPLLAYDEQGRLLVVSGPKVRGANKGNLTLDDVKKIVAGRNDLLKFGAVEKINVEG
jgi:hypothetical protein